MIPRQHDIWERVGTNGPRRHTPDLLGAGGYSKSRCGTSRRTLIADAAPAESEEAKEATGTKVTRARGPRVRCAAVIREYTALGGPAKTRHQKAASETRGRNGTSVAQFPTRRPRGICEMPRYRVVLRGVHMLPSGDRTGWLRRQDSKLCIPNNRLKFRGSQER